MQTTKHNHDAPPELEAAAALIHGAGRIIALCHVDPDGDAIGSLLGLGLALRALGKHVTLAGDDVVPWNLAFLPTSDQVVHDLTGARADLVIALDCGDMRRAGRVGEQAAALGVPLINMDHHVTNTRFGQVNVVDTDAVSTTEIVHNLLSVLGVTPDADVATCLLTGLVTDTRGFRTANVKQRVLLRAVALMDAGASLPRITELALDRRSFPALEMMGKALQRVRCEDGVIWSYMTREETAPAKVGGLDDTYDADARPRYFSSTLNTVEGPSVSVFFTEDPDGTIDISMRAKPGFELSALFGEGRPLHGRGGGHPLAAGAEIKAPLAEVVDEVVGLLKALVKEQRAASKV